MYSKRDRELIAKKLLNADWQPSEDSIDLISSGIGEVFQRQFDSEAEYLINELKMS